jgi:putative ABC transport system permease protein
VCRNHNRCGRVISDYLDWRAEQRRFVDLAALRISRGVISGIGEPERVFGRYVTASFFSTLRVQPQIGRFFGEDEEKPGAARVMVIGDGLWRRRFNADPAVIGRAINYNGASWTVLGVLPTNFDFYGRSNGTTMCFCRSVNCQTNPCCATAVRMRLT